MPDIKTEQPAQQEPVAWLYQCSADSSGPVLTQHKKDWAESGSGLWTETALYTTPQPPAQPLTDEPEIVQRVKRYAGQTLRTARNPNITARECIELAEWLAAHGITKGEPK